MVRADFIDVIDKLLRAFSGRNKNLPFGGIQLIIIGDTFQLPPIEGGEWEILKEFYSSPFFFSSNAFKDDPPIYIELKKIYRQNEIEFMHRSFHVLVKVAAQEKFLLRVGDIENLLVAGGYAYAVVETGCEIMQG